MSNDKRSCSINDSSGCSASHGQAVLLCGVVMVILFALFGNQ